MISVLLPVLFLIYDSLRSRVTLQAEVLALRHQILVLQRGNQKRRVKVSPADRLLWVWLSRLSPGWRAALRIVKPETVIAWHRKGFRLYWSWKSRPRQGRPPVSAELRELIRKMSVANPGWGAPRIHGELGKLGIKVSETTVARYMVRHRRPPSQTWRTFLNNHVKDLASADFFVVPIATFRLLFVFVILAHDRRRPVHFAVTSHPTAEWTAGQLVQAFPWDSAPRFLVHDRDGNYGNVFRETAAGLGIQEVPCAPRSPWQNAYAERLIGSIRRECLDHVIVFDESGLRRILRSYFDYYARSRTHLSLDKDAPIPRAVQPAALARVIELPEVGGLHHRYERRAA
jgi:transposase InsO family protein